MTDYGWLIAALFLPLFPLSMAFNALFQLVRQAWLRALLLLLWPLAGLAVLQGLQPALPDGVVGWALFTAALYAFRAVVINEAGLWCGFLATSAWALGWVVLAAGGGLLPVLLHLMAFSLPLLMLVFLIAAVEKRFASAFAGVVNGIAGSCPRLAGVFAITLLAAIGSPLFPSFFAMLGSISAMIASPAVMLALVAIWLLWSWSGMRLLQGLLVGPPDPAGQRDLRRSLSLLSGLLLCSLAVAGVVAAGDML